MNLKYVLVVIVLTTQLLVSVHCFLEWVLTDIVADHLVDEVSDKTQVRKVEVHNEGKHDAHLWCASRDDTIGNNGGLWVKPGDKIAWSFRKSVLMRTRFWCKMDWNGQQVSWDVFDASWGDAPNPTKWSVKNDGVYDQWRNRKWRELNG